VKQLKKHRIQVAAISETCRYDSGVDTIGDYTILHSGLPGDNKTKQAHGVAIFLDRQATGAWKNLGSIWEAISERILLVRLESKPVNVTLISTYFPVNPNGQKGAAESVDAFYNKLQSTIENISKEDMILIMGDFNARVAAQQHQTARGIIGPHTVDRINENGQRLFHFCSINDLVICNTFFQHKFAHMVSWMHPGNKKWHILDYIQVNRKFRFSVEDVRVHRTATGAIGTDHHLSRTKLKFHLRSRRKVMQHKNSQLDKKKLKNDDFIKIFQNELTKRTTNTSSNIDEKYNEFVHYTKNLSETIFGTRQRM